MNLTLQAYYRRGKEKQPDDCPGHPAVFSYGTGAEIHLITAFSLDTEGTARTSPGRFFPAQQSGAAPCFRTVQSKAFINAFSADPPSSDGA